MSRYYYFAATLPALQFGSPAPYTGPEFLERAARHLAAEDLALLSGARLASEPEGLPDPGSSSLLAAYYAWERSVRNELARLRARRLGRSPEAYLRPAEASGRTLADDDAARAAQAAFGAETPLEGELVLERERWAKLDALRGLSPFDLEGILAYRLQLAILERLARLRSGAGEARYKETYAAILGAAESTDMTGVPR